MVGNGFRVEKATFYVVKNGTKCLLGKDTATKLGVLKVGLGVNALDGTFPKFSSVKPISQPCRRVPIPLETKINKKNSGIN